MSKSKEKAALTLEGQMKQALVPESEQPYPVPENWCWTRLGTLIELISGRDVELKDCNNIGKGIPYILGASNLDNNTFTIERWIEFPQVISQKGDILLSVKGTIGKIYLQQELEINISRQIMALRPKKVYNTNYAYWFLQKICEELREVGNGLIPGISRKDIIEKVTPLPPLIEQQRIVDRIESLFAKLDEAKEKAQAALDSFETRKAAILHKAFTGKLTSKWREENGVGMKCWESEILKNICKISSGGTPSRTNNDYYVGNIPWIKTGEIFWNEIFDSEEKISDSALENSSAKIFPVDTIVVAMYGMGVTRGRAGILKIEAATNQAVCALIPDKRVHYKFLFYFFMNNYEKFRAQSVGGNQLNLSGKLISKFEIGIPSISEQTEIVRLLDSFFVKEQKAKELCSVLDKIDLIKKSILARAFRGELGTNDPTEESALELLKSIV